MAESERVLRNEEKYQELIDLFKSKREHKKGGGGREGGREGSGGGGERERERIDWLDC